MKDTVDNIEEKLRDLILALHRAGYELEAITLNKKLTDGSRSICGMSGVEIRNASSYRIH